MPSWWFFILRFFCFFRRPRVRTVDVVIMIRDKQHHDSAYAEFKIKGR